MSVLGVNVFALLVVFLGGVVTGAALVFFARGPVVAWFHVDDEPEVDRVFVEVLPPASPRAGRMRQHGAWERVASTPPTFARVPGSVRRTIGRGGVR